jgi:hypothetical protein
MSEQQEAIIDGICDYVDKYEIKEMLKEYLKRVVLEKPADPLAFLIQTIKEKPYVAAIFNEPVDADEGDGDGDGTAGGKE